MQDLRFFAMLSLGAACALGLCVALSDALSNERGRGDSCPACVAKTGRSPQGAGLQAAAPGTEARGYEYEKDVTEEAFVPGEFSFTGRSWNEVFDEKGESFAVYRSAYEQGSAVASIRIIPLGFGQGPEAALLVQLRDFLEAAFSSQVTIQKNVKMPEGCYDGERKQYHAGKILSGLMQNPWVHREKNLNLAVVTDDLFAPDLNFVFGYADYVHHISVISLSRLVSKNRKLTLRRVFKIARHEIGHMYGLVHCTAPLCVMRGVNNLEELDASTLSMCNGCVAKIAWRHGDDGSARSAALKALYIKKFPEFFR
jgi:archaemetzincin